MAISDPSQDFIERLIFDALFGRKRATRFLVRPASSEQIAPDIQLVD